MRWTNWARTLSCRPAGYFEPRDTAEVADIVRRAASCGRTLRAVGTGCSWSRLAPTRDWMISTAQLDRCLEIDDTARTIRIGAGAPVGRLNALAERAGMSLGTTSVYPGISVGGLLATGSHGTGRAEGAFSDRVVDATLVTASGEVVRAASDPQLLRAVRANLGALGVVTDLTVQCEPLFRVRQEDFHIPIADAIARAPDLVQAHDYVELFWWPCTDRAWIKIGDRTDHPLTDPDPRRDPSRKSALDGLIRKTLTPAVYRRLWKTAPAAIPRLIATAYPRIAGSFSGVVRSRSFQHYESDVMAVRNIEAGVPAERMQAAWRWTVAAIMEAAGRGEYPVEVCVHARFTGPSDAMLATSAGRDTCHLELLSLRDNPFHGPFYARFEEAMVQRFAGRLHWGKCHMNPANARLPWGDRLAAFEAVRAELDPRGRFLSDYLRPILQPRGDGNREPARRGDASRRRDTSTRAEAASAVGTTSGPRVPARGRNRRVGRVAPLPMKATASRLM